MINGELIVDNFAGSGGTSVGIRMATGSGPDIAVNHSPEAVRMHMANHPGTKHYCENIWQIDPVAVCGGNPVGLAWFSPDCTHFSKARGSKPREKSIRGLAWSACRWAALASPRVIILENVEEFKTWGPLGRKHRPIRAKQGVTFQKFVTQLQDLNYQVEYRELVAADYGAPTMRKRFFLVARRDGKPVVWPEPTHGPAKSQEVSEGRLLPYMGACTRIDFTLPCPSVFDASEAIWKKYGIRAVRPLAPKTLQRIAKGVEKFVVNNPFPFFIRRGEGDGDGMAATFIVQQQGMSVGSDIRNPLNTITAGGMGHMYLAMVHLRRQGAKTGREGMEKAVCPDSRKFFSEQVTVQGVEYRVTDIGIRILEPKELYGCQGFPEDYVISRDSSGKPCPRGEQVRQCGNAVCPPVPAALIRANLPELCQGTGAVYVPSVA